MRSESAIYLTINDAVSGVFASQVCDVVNFLQEATEEGCRLYSFQSMRLMNQARPWIRTRTPRARVLPMVPGIQRLTWNLPLLLWRLRKDRPKVAIGRGVFATELLLLAKESLPELKVVYDGRGATAAEFEEYDLGQSSDVTNWSKKLEAHVVLASDARLAVSTKLVTYWKEQYGYDGSDHEIIPCTLATDHRWPDLAKGKRDEVRAWLGIEDDMHVVAYAGSVAGWQSFELMEAFCKTLFDQDDRARFLLLAKEVPRVLQRFLDAGKILQRFVPVEEVSTYLAAADAGLLLREASVTNAVAFPTKFGEYLAAGLPVWVSDGLGDVTEWVKGHDLGGVWAPGEVTQSIWEISLAERQRLQSFARDHLSKPAHLEAYQRLLSQG